MPRVKPSNAYNANRGRRTTLRHGLDATQEARACVGDDHCADPIVPDCPVRLCGQHLREAYAFAADLVSERWDTAVREYVSDLHGTFVPPRAVKQPRAGWVYFLRFSDRVKIGYTTDPDKRLAAIPHDEVIGLVHGNREDERAWHTLLADYHVTGEWFRADPELLATLARVVEQSA